LGILCVTRFVTKDRRQSVAVEYGKVHHAPRTSKYHVRSARGDIAQRQPQQLGRGFVGRKVAAGLGIDILEKRNPQG
jgi:hypothetical protein